MKIIVSCLFLIPLLSFSQNQQGITDYAKSITPNELKELTPNATIGISLEEDLGLNYRYALPNKIFDYLHANVPVIVADLPEMRNLIKKHPIGEILTERTHKILAKTIINMTSISYEKELKTAKKELNWSEEKEKLISIFSKLDK